MTDWLECCQMWIHVFVELMLSVGLFIIRISVVDGYNNLSITNTKVLILVYSKRIYIFHEMYK